MDKATFSPLRNETKREREREIRGQSLGLPKKKRERNQKKPVKRKTTYLSKKAGKGFFEYSQKRQLFDSGDMESPTCAR